MENTLNENVLEVKDLQTRFRVQKRVVNAVSGVTFELKRGKVLGIVGESGCGKSVTAHSVLQLLPKVGHIENGSVMYYPKDGEPIDLSKYGPKSKEIRKIRGKDISMIFQDPMTTLNPVYTIGDQIVENLRKHEKLTKTEAKVRVIELLKKLGIPNPEIRFNEYPHQFSGGMKQRVMIAIAMICNPEILIADEPTTALDVTIQAQILGLMRSLQEEHGTSIILITHNMGIVAQMCDDVAVMYMGRVVEFGTLKQIFTEPKHPYTTALLRSVPVLGMDSDEDLETIEGSTPDASTVFKGCEFAERCKEARPECFKRFPKDTFFEDGHRVRCILYEENENG
ncbi:MAG: ABC transporter ATP-binding protein [Lachnospiraceae bacterium]|nr:ABC transporter ATP-binding protein [Lachnospiraceae bacterium]